MIRRFLAALLLLRSLAWADAYSTAVLADSPCGYWRMDAASGTAESGLGSETDDGTYRNTPTLNATGIPGLTDKAVTFASASTQYMSTPAGWSGSGCVAGAMQPCVAGSPHNFSAEAWFNPATLTINHNIISDNVFNSATKGWRFWVNSTGVMNFLMYQNDGASTFATVASTVTASTSAWRYLVAEVTGSPFKIQLYIDGAAENSTTTTTGTCIVPPSLILVAAGCNGANCGTDGISVTGLFNGTIDEPALYGTKPGATRWTAHYNAGITSAKAWPFTVRRPELPRFRDDGYFRKFVAKGYANPWNVSAMSPPTLRRLSLNLGLWTNFMVVPDGKGN